MEIQRWNIIFSQKGTPMSVLSGLPTLLVFLWWPYDRKPGWSSPGHPPDVQRQLHNWLHAFGPQRMSLRWRHNDRAGVSNHQPHGCLLNRVFRRRSKKTSKLCVTGLCAGNSPGPVTSPHKWPVTRKMFPFDDVIMFSAFANEQIRNDNVTPCELLRIKEDCTAF